MVSVPVSLVIPVSPLSPVRALSALSVKSAQTFSCYWSHPFLAEGFNLTKIIRPSTQWCSMAQLISLPSLIMLQGSFSKSSQSWYLNLIRLASECKDSPSNYHVLLIITDGVICDLEATKVKFMVSSSPSLSHLSFTECRNFRLLSPNVDHYCWGWSRRFQGGSSLCDQFSLLMRRLMLMMTMTMVVTMMTMDWWKWWPCCMC